MAVAAFDTLKVAKRMTDAGMERRQAEEFASVLADQMTADRADLSTKQDLAQTEAKIEAKIAAVRQDLAQTEAKIESRLVSLEAKVDARIAASEAKLEGKIAALDTKMEAKFGDQYIRLVTAMIAIMGLGVAVIKLFP